jgi:hypothetical protein
MTCIGIIFVSSVIGDSNKRYGMATVRKDWGFKSD